MDNFIAVIGGGPAGLRAAEVASAGGAAVTIFDWKASVGRKFLVAGGGGLNITKAEPVERFATRYRGPEMPAWFWPERIAEFGPDDLRAWAAGLGIETFAASTGRVYPREMKAAPLLRSWVRRLRAAGVHFEMHHRLVGIRPGGELE
ncbi:MAG TPA: NAD(P)/FAD-dependent oxidoreductase, partial [Chthoniobacterales bacterium]